MQQLLFLALFLICPLAMIFMMRGMGGKHATKGNIAGHIADEPLVNTRIDDLEREVSRLRGEQAASTSSLTRQRS